tara:strand:+ start:507 stop:1079 length:573 start_codon:yes stop_codon:yes gene_type:complete
MTCDSEKPVIMLVAGRTLDAERMLDHAIALGSSDLSPKARGYYLNIPRPVRILEGEPDARDLALMVRFSSECSAVNDWCEAAELSNSFVTKGDLADRCKTLLPEVGTWSRTGRWLPWMEMADRPGYLLYHGRSVKLMSGLDDLRPALRAHIETHYPTYTGAPDTFESHNHTSWTCFKKVLDARATAEGEG